MRKPSEPVTLASIAAAKAATQAERREVERLTGVRILDDGTVIVPCPKKYVDPPNVIGSGHRFMNAHRVVTEPNPK